MSAALDNPGDIAAFEEISGALARWRQDACTSGSNEEEKRGKFFKQKSRWTVAVARPKCFRSRRKFRGSRRPVPLLANSLCFLRGRVAFWIRVCALFHNPRCWYRGPDLGVAFVLILPKNRNEHFSQQDAIGNIEMCIVQCKMSFGT